MFGESGTGKELVARLIHSASACKSRPFIKFNCAAYNTDDIADELFGSKPTKTGHDDIDGLLNTISEGDLYINAIDLLPLPAQDQLAVFIKDSAFKNKKYRFIIASINNLLEESREGLMSQKFLSCFHHAIIHLPALRTRRADIVLLLKYFIKYFCKEYGIKEKIIENEALEVLVNYDWPGNVKELKNIVEKIVVSIPTTSVTLNDLPQFYRTSLESSSDSYYLRYNTLQEAEDAWRRNYLLYHLRKNNQNIRETAHLLNIKEHALSAYIKQYGIISTIAKKGEQRFQRTLKRSMVLSGRGLHSGIKTGLIISPLPPDSGIIFGNISDGETVPAHIDFVESTDYATSIKKGNARASTIEHFLAALHAYRITNLLIKINNEIPIMDGSAADFCKLFEDAGIEEQDAPLDEIIVPKRLTVGDISADNKYITLEPSNTFSVKYIINYPKPVGYQEYTFVLESEQTFKAEIAPARTFGFLRDIEALEKRGLASGGRLNNFILIDDEKIINTELRFADEFARHKILDLMGDMYLLGRPIRGKITAHMTGHTQNCSLLRLLREHIQLH
jgi:UDP-3-O-acyl N-acetylglucosamine deacetylase